jgi:hypothetical protein
MKKCFCNRFPHELDLGEHPVLYYVYQSWTTTNATKLQRIKSQRIKTRGTIYINSACESVKKPQNRSKRRERRRSSKQKVLNEFATSKGDPSLNINVMDERTSKRPSSKRETPKALYELEKQRDKEEVLTVIETIRQKLEVTCDIDETSQKLVKEHRMQEEKTRQDYTKQEMSKQGKTGPDKKRSMKTIRRRRQRQRQRRTMILSASEATITVSEGAPSSFVNTSSIDIDGVILKSVAVTPASGPLAASKSSVSGITLDEWIYTNKLEAYQIDVAAVARCLEDLRSFDQNDLQEFFSEHSIPKLGAKRIHKALLSLGAFGMSFDMKNEPEV